jgi:hypothetical protein
MAVRVFVLTWWQNGRQWSREFTDPEAAESFQAELKGSGITVAYSYQWEGQ